jgi:uncharacterized membrane protein YeaQ/YmgE (transglycosylase-associated protein family)
MDIVVWMLTGSLLGWIGCAYLGFNQGRGVAVSAIIGGLGGFLGGKIVAPIFTEAAAVPGDFSMSALLCAAAVATALLALGNMVHERWGV